MRWLIDNQIDFALRFPVSHLLTLRNGEVWRADALLAQHQERYFKDMIVDGIRLNMALKQLDGDWLVIGGPVAEKKLFAHYRYRWSIETFFQSLKKRVKSAFQFYHVECFKRVDGIGFMSRPGIRTLLINFDKNRGTMQLDRLIQYL